MISYWRNTIQNSKKEFSMLAKDKEVDVCIIGGGITGLTTAYYLSKTNLKIIIVEKDEIGSHTSGYTTAKITSQHDLFYQYLLNSYGIEYAKKYLEANEKAIIEIEQIIRKEKIQCNFTRQDAYVFTQKKEEKQKIINEEKALKKLNFETQVVKKLPITLPIELAIKFSNQAQFHPYQYMLGLAKCIEQNQSNSIYENTKVIQIKKEGQSYLVETENASVIKAKNIVMATRYPIINFPGYHFLKLYQETSYIIAAKLSKKIEEGMYINIELPTISLRTIPNDENGILLVGGMGHKTGEKQNLINPYQELENIAKQIDESCEVLEKWNTEDTISLDKLPYVGEFSNMMPNVYMASGYKKWGMTTSNIAANIIKDKITNQKNEYEEIFRATRLKPIKNIKELENMAKEVTNSLIIKKFKIPNQTKEQLKIGEGKIIEIEGTKVGAYLDEKEELFLIKPVCSHLGCELQWNIIERTWDCPCHGSRFDYTGKSIEVPSIKPLERMEETE